MRLHSSHEWDDIRYWILHRLEWQLKAWVETNSNERSIIVFIHSRLALAERNLQPLAHNYVPKMHTPSSWLNAASFKCIRERIMNLHIMKLQSCTLNEWLSDELKQKQETIARRAKSLKFASKRVIKKCLVEWDKISYIDSRDEKVICH